MSTTAGKYFRRRHLMPGKGKFYPATRQNCAGINWRRNAAAEPQRRRADVAPEPGRAAATPAGFRDPVATASSRNLEFAGTAVLLPDTPRVLARKLAAKSAGIGATGRKWPEDWEPEFFFAAEIRMTCNRPGRTESDFPGWPEPALLRKGPDSVSIPKPTAR